MREKIVLLAAALALANCESVANIGPPPGNARALIKAYIEETFSDPDSLRDVAIGDPEPGHIIFETGWIVCLQENHRDRSGGYAGLARTAYLISSDQIIKVVKDAPVCAEKTLQPWPELANRTGASK